MKSIKNNIHGNTLIKENFSDDNFVFKLVIKGNTHLIKKRPDMPKKTTDLKQTYPPMLPEFKISLL